MFVSGTEIRPGDRIYLWEKDNKPMGLVLQHFDRSSRYCMVRWDGVAAHERDKPIEKSQLRRKPGQD